MTGIRRGGRALAAGATLAFFAFAVGHGSEALAGSKPDLAGLAGGEDECGCHDFVTGGGWIRGTPDGAKGNFGVGGGVKNGALWGHLLFIDHGKRMKVKGTGVTGYEAVDEVTRRITGTCRVDGEDGFTYEVVVADRGEPGRDDSFSMRLSNGYEAGGTLGGGNIQLHKPRP